MRFLSILAIAGAACFAANADIAISKGNVEARNIYPRSLSGITYAGGDTFYMVADDLNGKNEIGLYKCKITFNAAGTTSTSNIPGTNKVVRLEGAKDLEAVAWDPSTGHIWAADESSVNAIREYDPETGAVLSVIDKPSIYKQCVSNYGFESVAIGCDGLSMWICNEEGLKCDDSRSSPTKGTVVRLSKFSRPTVYDRFELEAMYPYKVEKWVENGTTEGKSRRGVADLCALPDGSLLVLERDLSDYDLHFDIYRITTAGATDVKDYSSLSNGVPWTAVGKSKSLANYSKGLSIFGSSGGNFEGICLGPRLSNGNFTVVLVSDSGDGYSDPYIYPLVLSGLDASTVNFRKPVAGVSSIVGGPYRYMNGKTVDVELEGVLYPSAYTNNAVRVCSSVGWSAGSVGGVGPSASFVVGGGDMLFSWELSFETSETAIDFADAFETYAVDAKVERGEVGGWRGEGFVAPMTPAMPASGWPMAKDAHEKALMVDDAVTCAFPCTTNANDRLDMLVRVRRRNADETDAWIDSGVLVAVDCDAAGHLRVWRQGCGWMELGDRIYETGEWIRLAIALDATSEPGTTLADISVDGVSCGGPLPLAASVANGAISSIEVRGAVALDDVIKTTGDFEREIAGSGEVDGVPVAWLAANGYATASGSLLAPSTPYPAAFGPKRAAKHYTIGDVYAAGLDPATDELFAVTAIERLADGRLRVAFNGVREDLAGDGNALAALYPVYRRGTVDGEETPVDGDMAIETVTENGVECRRTVWTSREPLVEACGFYRIGVTR